MDYPHIDNASSLDQLNHNCDDYLILTTRVKENGSEVYAFQCEFCGAYRKGEQSKKGVIAKPPYSDVRLPEAYKEQYQKLLEQKVNRIGSISEEVTKRELSKSSKEVGEDIERLISEYCEENNLNTNSVLSNYLVRQRTRHVDSKFITDFTSEKDLHNWFVENFSKWFDIYYEVNGYGYLNRKKEKLRIDFVIQAKPELVESGFTDQFIGVEVKYLNPRSGNGFHGKSSKGIFQALSYWYSGARWSIPGKNEQDLATVLMFSNLSFSSESKLLFDTYDSHYKTVWQSYLSIANHANVGELEVNCVDGMLSYWSMRYSGAPYFSWTQSKGFNAGNEKLINKLRIGNKKAVSNFELG